MQTGGRHFGADVFRVKRKTSASPWRMVSMDQMLELIEAEFQPQQKECQASDLCRLGGVFFESTAGKKL